MKPLYRRIGRELLELLALGVLHAVLIRLLADRNVVAKLLSAGPHLSAGMLGMAVAFVVIRLLVVLVFPGYILARIACWFWDWRQTRSDQEPVRASR